MSLLSPALRSPVIPQQRAREHKQQQRTLIWSPTLALPPLPLGGAMSLANCLAVADAAPAALAGSRVHTYACPRREVPVDNTTTRCSKTGVNEPTSMSPAWVHGRELSLPPPTHTPTRTLTQNFPLNTPSSHRICGSEPTTRIPAKRPRQE
jgi:hypothetical protein